MGWIFDVYARNLVERHFYKINYNTVGVEKDKSILLIANHFSIWDGLILYWLAHRFLAKKFHVMILEETLKKEPMLKYGGAFPINKGSKNMIHSIDYAAQLLAGPQNLVLIFPQGKLCSNFVSDVHFEKGVMKIMDKAAGNFQLLYAATFIENFQHKKPTVNIYLSGNTNCTFENIEELNAGYQQHYSAARLLQTKIVL